MKPIDLHKPDHAPDLRGQVIVKPGPLADAVRKVATEAQLDTAAAMRVLMARGAEAMGLMKAG